MFRLAVAGALAALFIAWRTLICGALDGSVWDVKVKKDVFFSFSHQDTLAFDRGRFTSARFLSEGYRPSGYSARKIQEGSSWEASSPCGNGSQMDWHGVVQGDQIEGTVVLTASSGKMKTYAFAGRRKA
jgi:hypothetical protein